MRIGTGLDVHAFADNCPLILGGVTIDHPQGLAAHSDGDAVLHAICDALLGAAALGDIGQHFPSDDAAFEKMDSRLFLRQIITLLKNNHYRVVNVDATIIAQAPKMGPHIMAMRDNIADDLAIDIQQVSVKATTTDQLGFIGRNEGIAVQAVAMIEENHS